MGRIACKFGGSSLADATQFMKVFSIVESDPNRRFIVPSAPGKRHEGDTKITDLLYLCHDAIRQHVSYDEAFGLIVDRYSTLATGLSLDLDIVGLLDQLRSDLESGASVDYIASRGEFLNGKLLAALLGATYIEPADLIRFGADDRLDPVTYELLGRALDGPGTFVIPGFYGATVNGDIRTFSRGGSDITGAIVARAAKASIYENWTDVPGLLMADPRVVENPAPVEEITYREIRELAYMGASVFHDEAMFPVREAGIPIHIRNTNDPEAPGTRILKERMPKGHMLGGVAGRPGFTMLFIEKALMNQLKGFGRRVLEVIASHDISYEHTPSGIDTLSVIISDDELAGRGELLLEEIERTLEPDRVELLPGLALIATVGEGMSHQVGIAAKLFTALAEADVNVRVIDQGASEINIIVGVEDRDYERAVRAIYHAFETNGRGA
jgi:aspartate kinase